MSRKMNSIDDYLLTRWISGDISGKERECVEKWGDISSENEELLKDTQKVVDGIRELKLMESISSKNAIAKVKQRISGGDKFGRQIFIFWQKIAAIIVLPLLIYSLYQVTEDYFTGTSSKISWTEISTPVGLRSEFTLPDGTKVWLNGNTHLKFPQRFKGNERLVELQGEAFFKIFKNKKKPFVVDAGDLLVQAVGTSFNVSAYSDKIETALVEGRVNVLKETNRGRRNIVSMQPGQLAVYSPLSRAMKVGTKNLDKYLAWRDGKILFRNDSLEEVMRKLGQWYNVDFHIDPNVEQGYAYTGSFKGEGLHQILEYIELTTPVKFIFSEPLKNQDTTYVKRSITVVMKQ